MGHSIMSVRRVLIAALVMSALFAVALAEEEVSPTDVDAAGEEDDFDPVKDGTKEMEEMDSDKNGKATVDEVKAFMKERYYTKEEDLKELEKDKSGDLNLEEVIAQYKDDGSWNDEMPEEGEEEAADMDEGAEGAEGEAEE